MPYTEAELANIANASLDFYMKGPALEQSLQDRPLLDKLLSDSVSFPGGKEFIRKNVKGEYTTEFQGYSHDMQVGYQNPANIKQTQWKWYELHEGISVTESELKVDGISITDEFGENQSEHSEREMTAITGLMQDKMNDLVEGGMRSLNLIAWRDGTQDSLVFPGMQHIISGSPTTGILAGIDRAANSWWRNRARVGSSKVTASDTSQTLLRTIQDDILQLRRYGGKPNLWLGGSTAFNKLTLELRAKGNPTFTNFTTKGAMEGGQGEIAIMGLGTFVYDPTLDDLSLQDYMYMVDRRHLKLFVMEGEKMKKRAPARPYDRYVLYRAITLTGCMGADQLNCHEVMQVA